MEFMYRKGPWLAYCIERGTRAFGGVIFGSFGCITGLVLLFLLL